jgi:hypothetical protein
MKNKFNFTEGKWGYEYSPANDAYEIFPKDKKGEFIIEKEICITADNNKANARLISCVPEMLKALIKYITFLKNKKYYDPLTMPTIKLIEKATGKKWEEIIKDGE